MTDLALAVLSFPLLLALVVARVPVGLAMLAVGMLGNYLINGSWMTVLSQFKTLPYETFSNYSLAVVPMFLAMGVFAARGGLAQRLFHCGQCWLGHHKGGVAMSTIAACSGFGAVCGSSLATVAAISRIALPQLRAQGYPMSLSAGCLAAGGALGVLIPPSIVLIVYAVLAEQNVARLFVAALIPAALAVLGYMIAARCYAHFVSSAPLVTPRSSWRDRIHSLLLTWPVLLVFVVVISGIYKGFFTPSEGAGIGAVCTFLIAVMSGNMRLRAALEALLEVGKITAMIFFVILGAACFNSFLGFSDLSQAVSEAVNSWQISPMLVLIGIIGLYIVLGCFMDSLSMMLLTIPIFFPLLSSMDFGMDAESFALWFGILVLVAVEMGLITPPVGLNLFVIQSLSGGASIAEVYKGTLPFLCSDLARIALLLCFPALATGLLD